MLFIKYYFKRKINLFYLLILDSILSLIKKLFKINNNLYIFNYKNYII